MLPYAARQIRKFYSYTYYVEIESVGKTATYKVTSNVILSDTMLLID